MIALDNVTLDIASGQFTAIMGPSGSGKSTLMHCLAGLDSPSGGEAFLGDTRLSSLDDTQLTLLRRKRIGFIFQSFNLLPAFTARQNILLPLELAGIRPDLQWFGMLVSTLGIEDRLSHRPAELSGGQQQRVAIARALMARPDVIVADEPTGNLDSRASEQVLGFLQQGVRELGQTIVMVPTTRSPPRSPTGYSCSRTVSWRGRSMRRRPGRSWMHSGRWGARAMLKATIRQIITQRRRRSAVTLPIEGVLIAGIGGLIGIVTGVVFGWIGALTLIGDQWDVTFQVPVGWLLATVTIAVLTGLLASVLPARRAVREDPIVALAET